MPINREADDRVIAPCSGATSPGLLFNLIALDDALSSAGFNRGPGFEVPGLGKPHEQAYPADK